MYPKLDVDIVLILLNILSIAIPALVGLFSFWSSCKKDGFDQEKAFDLIFLGLVGGGVVALITGIVTGWSVGLALADANLFAFAVGFIGVGCLVAYSWKWSLYRILDNLAMALTLSVGFWLLGRNIVAQIKLIYLVTPVVLFAVYAMLQKYRLIALKSGFTFCLVTGVFCLASALSMPKLVNLIFIGLLATLVLTVLIFRLRSLYGGTKKSGRTPVTS